MKKIKFNYYSLYPIFVENLLMHFIVLKKLKRMSFLITFILIFLSQLAFSQETEKGSFKIKPSTQQNSFVLPPIRRIGISIVQTNVDEFRNFMRKQDRLLHGISALPYNEQDIKKLLTNDFEDQTKNTGRFWQLSLIHFSDDLNINKNKENQNNLKGNLEVDYNLDAWLNASVYFAPDQTLVRITLSGIGMSTSNWAREDMLLEAQADEGKIASAFSEALKRIISTIGHDGRITYTRENLVTVDFGTERGLQRGQKIIGGYVFLTSFHPQTGEFLRSKRVPIYELKVLEARPGSSLCQITAIDKVQYEQTTKMLDSSTLVMLAWKEPQFSENKFGWKEPYNPQTAPLLGATESGFGVPLEKNESIEKSQNVIIPKNMGEPSELQKKSSISHPEGENSESHHPVQNLENKVLENTENNLETPHFLRKSRFDNPQSWHVLKLPISAGAALGSFAEGEAAAFPVTFLNFAKISTFLDVDSRINLFAEPYAQYAFYNGNSISGSSYYFGIKLYNLIWSDPAYEQRFYLGGGLEATGGTITQTKLNRKTDVDLSNIEISPSIKWSAILNGFGSYDISAGFSMLDLVNSSSVWMIGSSFHPYEFMTKQLGFDIGLKRYKKDWIEFTFGVSWDFLPNYSKIINKN